MMQCCTSQKTDKPHEADYRTKETLIPLKADSTRPFLKLILFNDKKYYNRWVANCKINQNIVKGTEKRQESKGCFHYHCI